MTNQAVNCPFCIQAGLPADTTRNLHVRSDGIYHCFRCGATRKKNGPLPVTIGFSDTITPKRITPQDIPTRVHPLAACVACQDYLTSRKLQGGQVYLPNSPLFIYGGFCRGHRIFFEIGGWWQGRATSPRNPIRYLFPRNTGQPKPLFHMDPTRGRSKTLCVVEGPFDALRLFQEGFRVVALCGKSFSTDKLAQLQEMAPKRLIWCWDKDVLNFEPLPWFLGAEPFSRGKVWKGQDGADPAEASARDIAALRKIVRGRW